jgi:hypothetical protein
MVYRLCNFEARSIDYCSAGHRLLPPQVWVFVCLPLSTRSVHIPARMEVGEPHHVLLHPPAKAPLHADLANQKQQDFVTDSFSQSPLDQFPLLADLQVLGS